MKIGVIGLGIAGLYYSLLRKKFFPKDEVTVFEHNDENYALRKILVAGNGKVNLGNSDIKDNSYNNKEFIENKLKNVTFHDYIEFLNDLGIYTVQKHGTCLYPVNLDGGSMYKIFIELLKKNKIVVNYDSKITDFGSEGNKVYISVKGKKQIFDRIVFATGGCSSPSLGSDGSITEMLKEHNILVKDFKPGLTGIRTKESFKKIEGIRADVVLKIITHNHYVYEEEGELLFKKDGLSGIVSFDILSMLNRLGGDSNQISIDFISPHFQNNISEFIEKVVNNKDVSKEFMMNALLNNKLASYFLNKFPDKSKEDLFNLLRDFRVEPIGDYGFKNSHCSIGGIKLDELNENYSLVENPNIFFVGEVVDIDGLCGGYNIFHCFISSYLAAKN